MTQMLRIAFIILCLGLGTAHANQGNTTEKLQKQIKQLTLHQQKLSKRQERLQAKLTEKKCESNEQVKGCKQLQNKLHRTIKEENRVNRKLAKKHKQLGTIN